MLTFITGGEEEEEAENSGLLPQLFLIASITEQEIAPGPIQTNGKSLARFSFLISKFSLLFWKLEIVFSDILFFHQHATIISYFLTIL